MRTLSSRSPSRTRRISRWSWRYTMASNAIVKATLAAMSAESRTAAGRALAASAAIARGRSSSRTSCSTVRAYDLTKAIDTSPTAMISATAVAKNSWSRIVPRFERSIGYCRLASQLRVSVGRSRRAHERPLGGVAAKRQQPGDHRRGFDAFSNDRQPRLCARSIVERTMTSSSPRSRLSTNDWSILSPLTGSRRR